jgi:CRISPR-associated endoribonuclease Cas6
VTFHLQACRFHLAARDSMHFRPGQAGNVLRGALGSVLRKITSAEDYSRIFEPASSVLAAGAGPSGLADWPRPFVIRAASLDGQTLKPGDPFSFGINLFDRRNPAIDHFTRAFAEWAHLDSVEHAEVVLDLSPESAPIPRIRVEFQTPTELKAAGQIGKGGAGSGVFSVLLARARDRLSTLRSLYGAGPLEIDFRGLAERARSVKTVRCELRSVAVERRSSRTGKRHDIGGFIGSAEYEGDLAEFLPYLKAAHWTGVGRHCTWGNGQIHVVPLS